MENIKAYQEFLNKSFKVEFDDGDDAESYEALGLQGEYQVTLFDWEKIEKKMKTFLSSEHLGAFEDLKGCIKAHEDDDLIEWLSKTKTPMGVLSEESVAKSSKINFEDKGVTHILFYDQSKKAPVIEIYESGAPCEELKVLAKTKDDLLKLLKIQKPPAKTDNKNTSLSGEVKKLAKKKLRLKDGSKVNESLEAKEIVLVDWKSMSNSKKEEFISSLDSSFLVEPYVDWNDDESEGKWIHKEYFPLGAAGDSGFFDDGVKWDDWSSAQDLLVFSGKGIFLLKNDLKLVRVSASIDEFLKQLGK